MTFYDFFDTSFKKNVKSHVFFEIWKNVKYVFSNTAGIQNVSDRFENLPTCPDWFWSTGLSHAIIPVAVAESIIRVADFGQMAPLRIIKLMRLELKDVFKSKRRWNVPKIMQIG